MLTFSPVRGLTPWRALRCDAENFPKPVNETSWPDFKASVIESSTASTAFDASLRERPLFDATCSTNSCFVTASPPGGGSGPRAETLARVSAGCGSTMRFCGGCELLRELSRAEERTQSDGVAGECVGAALVAVDDADRRPAD